MSSKRLITVCGATGAQGSGVINTVLSVPALSAKYSLRAITRNTDSTKSLALKKKGVEVVKGDFNDIESLKAAVKGSYGVFGMTDFWSIHSQELEMQHGRNIFDACKIQGVRHYVWSSLPSSGSTTDVAVTQLPYYDGKAIVEEYIEANKGEMIASYILPAMFYTFIENLIRGGQDGAPHLTLPVSSETLLWPFIDPFSDGGKFIMGFFEAGDGSNGAKVHAVSAWTTPKELVETLSKESGKHVALKLVSTNEFAKDFPDNISGQLTDTLLMVIENGVYGKRASEDQAEHDKWLVAGGGEKISLADWIHQHGPWSFETKSFFDVLATQKSAQIAGAPQEAL